ncbi:hypothetical protein BDZ90DRAFT_41277 [Jaminaea rosea]|uniref:Uncharacterized protein n=1 Tax=Jaminaea rosea TaxID=1569628 RepID=A0A316UP55_9BASI|nr:hypothetical protein BDZ90DRAFT_41277 [Jaminaea rosea]PWN26548.1 hypothetical protein BDZ90DRAFT_41277 [Jaminaea rosea]
MATPIVTWHALRVVHICCLGVRVLFPLRFILFLISSAYLVTPMTRSMPSTLKVYGRRRQRVRQSVQCRTRQARPPNVVSGQIRSVLPLFTPPHLLSLMSCFLTTYNNSLLHLHHPCG